MNLVCSAVKKSLILFTTNLVLIDFPRRNLDASSQCNQQQECNGQDTLWRLQPLDVYTTWALLIYKPLADWYTDRHTDFSQQQRGLRNVPVR